MRKHGQRFMAAVLSAFMVLGCAPAYADAADPNSSAERETANAEISEKAALGGMVLLDNSSSALPIPSTPGTPVALYGTGVYRTVKGGSGSGDVDLKPGVNVTVLDGFLEVGYDVVNEAFLKELETQAETASRGENDSAAVFDEPAYNETSVKDAAGKTQLAVYVLSRISGEGKDRITGETAQPIDYYLTDHEAANLRLLGKTFGTVIVVLNVGGIIDTNFYHGKGNYAQDDKWNRAKIEGLDALFLMSQAGQRGGAALVKALNGMSNPSGKLTDTWAIDIEDYPAGNFSLLEDWVSEEEYYIEDIYVGYRYFDTFGKDVAYPFGYGGSYTSFQIQVAAVTATASQIRMTASVENTGEADGQEVVEVYFSAPSGGLDKPFQELAAFQKVAVEAGKTETVTVSFDTADMSSYDESREAYILAAGDYILRVGNSSRNTIAAATITLDQEVVTEYAKNQFGLTKAVMKSGMYDAGQGYVLNPARDSNSQFILMEIPDPFSPGSVQKIKTPSYQPIALPMLDGSSANYGKGITPTQNGVAVPQRFRVALSASAFGAPAKAEYAEGKITTYVSERADADSAKYAAGRQIGPSETLQTVAAAEGATLVDVVSGAITMEQLVADMSNDELAALTQGGNQYDKLRLDEERMQVVGFSAPFTYGAAGETTYRLYTTRYIPNIMLSDGPAGLRIELERRLDDETVIYQNCTAFPIGTLLAQTWDPELVEEVGRALSVEMLEYHASALLAPGMNIHRHPLCGRNFEYYSEDPVVAGVMAVAETIGVETNRDGSRTGVGVTLKHIACNNQEINRMGSNSVVSERAAREIYLKGFEIAIKKAQPAYVMSSYNMLNGTPTFEHYGLLTEILRCEWGYDGIVMSDWNATMGVRGKRLDQILTKDAQGNDRDWLTQGWLHYAGNDCEMPGNNVDNVLKALDEGGTMRLGDLQRSAMRMLNAIRHTPVFMETLDLIIEKSPDAEEVAAARKAKANLEANDEITIPAKATADEIEAALNAANAKKVTFAKDATYEYAQLIRLTKSDLEIDGNGATLKWAGEKPFDNWEEFQVYGGPNQPVRNVYIHDLNFETTNRGGLASVQMLLYYSENVRIENCAFTASDGHIQAKPGEGDGGVTNIWICGDSKNIRVEGCTFQNLTHASGRTGVDDQGNKTTYVGAGGNIWLSGNAEEEGDYVLSNITIQNNWLEKSSHDESIALWRGNFDGVFIQNNTFKLHEEGEVGNCSDICFLFGENIVPAADVLEDIHVTGNTMVCESRWALANCFLADGSDDLDFSDNIIFWTKIDDAVRTYGGFLNTNNSQAKINLRNNEIYLDGGAGEGLYDAVNALQQDVRGNTIELRGKISHLSDMNNDELSLENSTRFQENAFFIHTQLDYLYTGYDFCDNTVIFEADSVPPDRFFSYDLRTLDGQAHISGNYIRLNCEYPTKGQYDVLLMNDCQFGEYVFDFTKNVIDTAVPQNTENISFRMMNLVFFEGDVRQQIDARGTRSNLYTKLNYWGNSVDPIVQRDDDSNADFPQTDTVCSAQWNGDALVCTLTVPQGTDANVWLACYSQKGQLLDVRSEDATGGGRKILRYVLPDHAESVKLFVIENGTFRPLCAAWFDEHLNP